MPRKSALTFVTMAKLLHQLIGVVVAVAALGIALTAGAADPALLLSGRVTDDSGIEPVAGAVVSLELGLKPDGSASKDAKLPARLAVWQARTSADGTFSLPARTQALTLPPGTALSEARLKVFALAYAPYKSSDIKLNIQPVSQRQIKILPSRSKTNMRLTLQPQDDPWITAQLDAMYAELHDGTQGNAWAGGRQQALESFGPLLSLLATSCQQVEALSDKRLDACLKAGKEFDLGGALSNEVRFIRREPDAPASAQPTPATPTIMKASPPEQPSQGSVKQLPPGD